MKYRFPSVIVLLMLVFVVVVVHCGKEDDGVIIKDNVVLPEQNAELQEVIIVGDTLKFVYTAGSTLPQFSAEEVVVGQEAGGYLKKVVTSVPGGDTVTLLTEPAVLTDAVEQAVVDTTFGLALQAGGLDGLQIDTMVTGRSGQVYGLKVTSAAPQLLCRGESFEVRYPNVVIQIYTSGNLAVAMAVDTLVLSKNIDIDFDLEIRAGAIDRFRFIAGSTDGVSFRGVTIDAVYSISDDLEFLLAPLNLGTIVVWIGALPVVFTFELNLYAGLEAALTVSAAAQFANNVALTATSAIGAEWSGGAWQAISDWSLDGDGDFELVQSATMDAMLKGYLRGSLGAKLYGVVGPELYLKGYQYNDINYPPLEYELGVGLGAGLAFQVQVLSWELLDFNHTFAEYSEVILRPSLEVPDVSYEVELYGGTLRIEWDGVEYADGYIIYRDGVVEDTLDLYSGPYYADIPAKKYGVSAFSTIYGETAPCEIHCEPVTSINVEVWGSTDPDTSHHAGYGFDASGAVVTYSISNQNNWPDIDHWICSDYYPTMYFVSPDQDFLTVGPFNSEENFTANSGGTVFDDFDIALPPMNYYNLCEITSGSVYFLWIDPNANGWDNTVDHYAKIKVVGVEGLKVTLIIAFQPIPGLRWLVTP